MAMTHSVKPLFADFAMISQKILSNQSATISLIESASNGIWTLLWRILYAQDRSLHVFDDTDYNPMQPKCPVCRLPLTIDLEAPALELEENVSARQGILGRLNLDTWRSSTKIEALVEELSNLRLQDSCTKSLVFSQFVNFLDLIAFRLQKAGFIVSQLQIAFRIVV
jgi:hypothetical protein